MKATVRALVVLTASAVVVSGTTALVLSSGRGCLPLRMASGSGAQQHRAFKSVRVGMTRTEVFQRMSWAPLWTNSEFTLGQYEGNETEYAKTNGVNAEVFYTWLRGADYFYCVGFDKAGRVVVKGEGGT